MMNTVLPRATCRMQIHKNFNFSDAAAVITYLAELGFSHVYLSPILQARTGSLHGYDVVDPLRIDHERGGDEGFLELCQALGGQHMKMIIDIVPNHMAIDSENRMLMNIFEHGQLSPYLHFFDIQWKYFQETLEGKMLVPILGKFYAEALDAGEIKLVYGEQGLCVQYYGFSFPLLLETYEKVFQHLLGELERSIGSDNQLFIHYLGAIHFFNTIAECQGYEARKQQMHHAKHMLWDLYTNHQEIKQFIDRTIACFNCVDAGSSGCDLLDALLALQVYRLAFWKMATEEINYRRFFTVNDLISMRVEDPDVFSKTHARLLSLFGQRVVDGFRIDHIDGLLAPKQYLENLRAMCPDSLLFVEKILECGENLPADWPVQGTTGYDFLSYVNGLYCDKKNEQKFSKIYFSFTRVSNNYDQLVCEKKRLIIGKHMAGNIDILAREIKELSSHDRWGRDITLYGLRRALVDIMASFSVYRTYADENGLSDVDRDYIEQAIEKSKEKNPGLQYEIAYIKKFLLLHYDETTSQEDKVRWLAFLMRFQQQTGPLMAKGFEDTVLYVFNRLISLNEVGSNPIRFGMALPEFHNFVKKRQKTFPNSLNATATHDTKRGEDVRARINVLSEMPEEWNYHLKLWSRQNSSKRVRLSKELQPDGNDEYLLYQTLIGTYPFEAEADYLGRIKEYMIKAVREAKVHTAWIKPDTMYEEAFLAFVDALFSGDDNHFLDDFLPFQSKVAYYGIFNSLSQLLLKLTVPGVPDVYQGTELWDFHLVDPDNRRSVDFSNRIAILEYFQRMIPQNVLALTDELLRTKEDGRIKMFLMYRVLYAKKIYQDIFEHGEYKPLQVRGKYKDCIIAFARLYKNDWVITIAPRFLSRVVPEEKVPLGPEVWEDTTVILTKKAPRQFHDLISSQTISAPERIAVGHALRHFPVALLRPQR
jgi:(1->4)-alpha-D-glucan 1-alpha-D-glucosylmutase